MMLPADMAIAQDKAFRKIAETYAKDEDKFFADFAKAFATLLELGVPKEQFKTEPWSIKPQ
jgi:cytochrome c peroxidase